MSKSLEERLKTHSSAFDGLLSLIPAKYYYDQATQEQWKEKKKSKEELKLNKKLKLDPTVVDFQSSSAKDILKQRELVAHPVVIPGNNLKKLGITEQQESEEEEEQDDSDVPEVNQSELEDSDNDDVEEAELTTDPKVDDDSELINISGDLVFDDEGNEIEKSQEDKIKQEERKNQQKKAGKKQLTAEEIKERDERLAKLREKLSSKITALKEKRKAPGTVVNGAPSSREQILELRKLKLEQRKKRKLEDMEKSDNSDGDDDDEGSDEDEDEEVGKQTDSVLFQNIVFNDGDRITSDLTALRKAKGKKGPSNNDIKAHLAKLKLQKQKLSEMDSEKRLKHEEKNKWNRLVSNIEGVKLKDDEKLLKKALKRKEKQKMKSEREWRERKETVDSTIAARLKRREENLQLRKENKGKKSKNQLKMKRKFTGIINKRTTPGATGDKKKRAGFEGRSKTGKKK